MKVRIRPSYQRLQSELAEIIAQMPTILESVGGVDVKKLLKKLNIPMKDDEEEEKNF